MEDIQKTKVKARLSKAIGHLSSVQRMVDCKTSPEVLDQIKAVQGALDRTAEILLEEHLKTIFADVFQDQSGYLDQSKTLEQLVRLYRRSREL